ncbi:hypothetical protein VK98_21215 [Chromobacterium sp. LK11]|uniref:hypothetical protein n=1 Tax=Chromobacterium sp. LK11 TaxID=1628212 RepID=UPI00065410CB|nr:hypothetical protein [Chromobacterium sp. LK11]KMN76433.1 hypothetical protein VK98_21215 [Chromobacterium sp. LK11]
MKEVIKPVPTPDTLFHDGNPSSGELGTIVGADWLNNVQSAVIASQEELLTVVKSSGQSADPARKDQLLQAVKQIAWGGASKPTTLAGYGITDAMKIDDWGINGYKELQVGPGREFADIASAWNSLNGKTLKTDVLIKVDDGQYTATGIWLGNQPFASRIRIRGNIANPSACQIRFVAGADKNSHGVVFTNARGVEFSGFHLIGEATEGNWTHRCLHIGEGSWVWGAENSLILEGAGSGLQVEQNSRFSNSKLRVNKVKEWGVVVGGGSHCELHYVNIVGEGKNFLTKVPVRLDANDRSAYPHGMLCADTSRAWVTEGRVMGVRTGFHAARNSYLWCDGSVVEQSAVGFEAHSGAVIWNHGSGPVPALPQGRRGKALTCDTGFQAVWAGVIYAPMAIAENCNNGFRALCGTTMVINGGWAKNCQVGFETYSTSYLEAYDTKAASTGCPTVYSPATSGVAGNANSVLSFS